MAVAEVPPLEDDQTQVPGTESPAEKPLRVDGMPVTQHKVQITGGISVSTEMMRQLKIGKRLELKVAAVVDSRKDKAITNFGEPTGDVKRQIVIVVVDILEDEDGVVAPPRR